MGLRAGGSHGDVELVTRWTSLEVSSEEFGQDQPLGGLEQPMGMEEVTLEEKGLRSSSG